MGAKLDRWLQRKLAKAQAKGAKATFRPTPMTFADAATYAESVGMGVPPLEREIDGVLCSMAALNEIWARSVGTVHAVSGHLRALKSDPTVFPLDKARRLTPETAEKTEDHLLQWLLDERRDAWSEAPAGLEASSTPEGAIAIRQPNIGPWLVKDFLAEIEGCESIAALRAATATTSSSRRWFAQALPLLLWELIDHAIEEQMDALGGYERPPSE